MDELCREVIHAFSMRGLTLGTAESLTGGLIAAGAASVSGASAVLMGGVVAYDPRVKRDVLGVAQEVIDRDGVVSEACARQMAQGARRVLGVDVAVSATGIAGPSGGTAETPVGTVFIGCASAQGVRAAEYHLTGDRQEIRWKAAQHALEMALEEVRG